ncbi:MAG TPA: ComEC/Rec2 family competence protein [Candidatus Saccharimonadales bacterium]|nr:ComEC/Rec2 family competence protein [Candidatus Saccharimonadales bacterium]
MNTTFDFFYTIPFPHILLTLTATTFLTIFFILHGYWFAVPFFYIAALSYLLYKKNNAYLFVVSLCLMFSLGILLQIKHQYTNYHSYEHFLKKTVHIAGTILQINDSDLTKQQTTILLKTNYIYSANKQVLSLPQNILIFLSTKRAEKFKEGQEIIILKAELMQPEPRCPYETYLIKEHIWATTYIGSQKINILKQAELPLYKKCFNLFSKHLNKSTTSLFNPLFLGKREKNKDILSIQHYSLYWGIAHHMARSGIHLVTLFGLIMTLLHYAGIRHSYRYALGALLSIGYFQITFPSISFIRALCMILFQMFSKLNKFTYSSIHALTMTTFLVILHNPLQILFLDFQLSFAVTYIIIWLFQAKYAKTIAFNQQSLVRS